MYNATSRDPHLTVLGKVVVVVGGGVRGRGLDELEEEGHRRHHQASDHRGGGQLTGHQRGQHGLFSLVAVQVLFNLVCLFGYQLEKKR